MNKLAAAGILFQNTYVTTSICCVSRASILTGQYESMHRINDFRTDLTPESLTNSHAVLLKRAGYKMGFTTKFGIGTHQPRQLFDVWVNIETGGKIQPNYITTDKKW